MTAAHPHRPSSGPWLTLLGLLTVGLGVLAVASPLVSRTALLVAVAVGALVAGILLLTRTERPWQLAGGVWIVVGIAATFWPDRPFPVLSTLVGIGLLTSGAIGLLLVLRHKPRPWGPMLVDIAVVIAGVAVIIWADVSILATCLVLGIYLLTLGITCLLHDRWHREPQGWGKVRTIGAGALTVLAVALLVTGGWLNAGIPEPDDFYDPPADLPAEPGILLRAEPFTESIPDGTQAWRILYTTTRDEGIPAVASGVVLVPTSQSTDPLPVVTWAHGTSGFARGCAPSILPDTYDSTELYLIEQAVVQQGWAVVATDYVGLGTTGPHPYLVGQGEARSVLDANRAARQLEDIALSSETVVWGHSQGGHAALWTGQLAPTYAPDAGVIAVAAMAPAANLPALVESLLTLSVGSLFGAYVLEAYSQIYPDVTYEEVVLPRSQVLVKEIAYRCLHEPAMVISLGSAVLLGADIWNGDPMNGPMGPYLEENVPLGPIDVPLFIGQGLADQLIHPDAQADYVQERCAMGTELEYHTYAGLDHMPLVEEGSALVPELMQWTQDRWDSNTVTTDTCS